MACAVLMGAVAMIATTYGVLAVPLGKEFGPSRMMLMMAMTVMALVTAILSPLLGGLMDKLPLRKLMALGAALLICGFVALSFATSFTQVLVIYGVLMAPANVLIGPMIATVLLSRWFVRRRGRALGMAIAGISVAGFVFPPLIQALLDLSAWREAVRVLAAIFCALLVPAILLIIDDPASRGLAPDGDDAPPVARADARHQNAAAAAIPASAILSNPTFWMIAALFAFILAGMKGMVTNVVPLAIDEGVAPQAAALLISTFAAAGFVAKLVFAAIADRLDPRLLLATAAGGFAAGMACLTFAEAGYAMMALAVALVGLFGGLVMPLQSMLVPRIFGQAVIGRASGLLNFVVLGLLLASPPLFGLIFDKTGSYDAIFAFFAAASLATILLVPSIRLTPRAAPANPAAETH